MVRASHGLVVLVAALCLMAGCSKPPTSPGGQISEQSLSSSRPVKVRTFILPRATGTVRGIFETGALEPRGTDVVSGAVEQVLGLPNWFLRGFAEFEIPRFTKVYAASVLLREPGRSWPAYPVGTYDHELAQYGDADLVVDTSDYHRPAAVIGSFTSDSRTLAPEPVEFDISRLVDQTQGGRLGFRVKLQSDPLHLVQGGLWLPSYTTPPSFVIEVTTTPLDAIAVMLDMVRAMRLEKDVEASLRDPLLEADAVLRDASPLNDPRACSALAALRANLDAVEGPRHQYYFEVWCLRELSSNLLLGLGCRTRGSF